MSTPTPIDTDTGNSTPLPEDTDTFTDIPKSAYTAPYSNTTIDLMTGKVLPSKFRFKKIKAGLWRDQYKYRKLDTITNTFSDDYILAQYEIVYKDDNDIDRNEIAIWSISRFDDFNEEIHTTPYDQFHKMLDSDGWEQVGHEMVIVR